MSRLLADSLVHILHRHGRALDMVPVRERLVGLDLSSLAGLTRAAQTFVLFERNSGKRLSWWTLSYASDWLLIGCAFFGFPWTGGPRPIALTVFFIGVATGAVEAYGLRDLVSPVRWLIGAIGVYPVAVGLRFLAQSMEPSTVPGSHMSAWVFLLVAATARASVAELVFLAQERRPLTAGDPPP